MDCNFWNLIQERWSGDILEDTVEDVMNTFPSDLDFPAMDLDVEEDFEIFLEEVDDILTQVGLDF